MNIRVVFYGMYGHVYPMAEVVGAGDGKRMPGENELAIARFQGRHAARITSRLVR